MKKMRPVSLKLPQEYKWPRTIIIKSFSKNVSKAASSSQDNVE